jgi:hypothetical protein
MARAVSAASFVVTLLAWAAAAQDEAAAWRPAAERCRGLVLSEAAAVGATVAAEQVRLGAGLETWGGGVYVEFAVDAPGARARGACTLVEVAGVWTVASVDLRFGVGD